MQLGRQLAYPILYLYGELFMVTLFCVYYADNTDPENLVGIVFTLSEAKKICDEYMQIVKIQVNDRALGMLLAHGVKCK